MRNLLIAVHALAAAGMNADAGAWTVNETITLPALMPSTVISWDVMSPHPQVSVRATAMSTLKLFSNSVRAGEPGSNVLMSMSVNVRVELTLNLTANASACVPSKHCK